MHRFARTLPGVGVMNWALAHAPFVIPSERLRETETLIAFHHPNPSHSLHILIVPKATIRTIMDVTSDSNDFPADLFAVVQSIVEELNLEESSYRLIMNGGVNQDVKQLHFHLISDGPPEPDS